MNLLEIPKYEREVRLCELAGNPCQFLDLSSQEYFVMKAEIPLGRRDNRETIVNTEKSRERNSTCVGAEKRLCWKKNAYREGKTYN